MDHRPDEAAAQSRDGRPPATRFGLFGNGQRRTGERAPGPTTWQFAAVFVALIAWGPVFVTLYWVLGDRSLAIAHALVTLGVLAAVIAVWRGANPVLTGNVAAADLAAILIATAWREGGVGSAAAAWLPLVGALALLLAGRRSGIVWGILTCAATLALYQLERHALLPKPTFSVQELAGIQTIAVAGVVVASLTILIAHEGFELVALRALWRSSKELDAARQQAESGMRARRDFLAMMSHEIRTPLTAILGYAQRLSQSGRVTPDALGDLDAIRGNATHLLRIMDNMLALSSVEAGDLCLEPGPCAPIEIVEEIAEMLAPRAADRGLAFRVEYRGAIPDCIRTDKLRLRLILVSLIENALKFTMEGEVRLVVSVARGMLGVRRSLRFEVIDSGIGLTAAQRASLFEPFVQGDTSTARRYPGIGVGLALSRNLAELLGGEIVVESAPGVGSAFVLVLPINPVASEDGVEPEARPTPPATAARARRPTPRRLACRVLLVDDVTDTQRLFSLCLREAGADVEVAGDGAAAVQMVLDAAGRDQPFDVVLMDMQMPMIDGYEATTRLRKAGYQGRIIAFTAHAMKGDQEACIAAGCDDFVAKPVQLEALVEAVARNAGSGRPVAPPPDAASSTFGQELQEITRAFQLLLPERATALETSLSGGDLESVKTLAHQLRGMAGGFGFPAISEAAAELEELVRARGLLDEVRDRVARVAALCRAAATASATKPAER